MDRHYSEIAYGRFNQKRTGKFRVVPENVVLRIVATIAIFAVVIILLLVVSGRTINGTVSLVLDAIAIALLIFSIPAVRMQYAGKEWTYTITDKQFSLVTKGQARNYKYKDVEGVSYEFLHHPITRRKIGFIVSVKTKYTSDKYKYISILRGEQITPQSTPFYILNDPPKLEPEFDRFSEFTR
ncbi:MAG: hypothetical protein E7490_00815 [Ruminococcaceae bacterium]|nr:hypothetical protein [Oscillospiraceae bacterium]